MECDVLVMGGGPAGLRAAELTSGAGLRTVLADRMRSVGRKFLVAGRGGLNLTHSEPMEAFRERYGEPAARWTELLDGFSPEDARAWAGGLGIETFVGTSRRVFPVGKQAAPLLRRWKERLRRQGVDFCVGCRLVDFRPGGEGSWEVTLVHEDKEIVFRTRALILALGGASWPQTGSDGAWTTLLAGKGVSLTPLAAANCGFEVDWPSGFVAEAEGLPLKNVVVRAGDQSVAGELLFTKYGVEGGAIYQLGAALRSVAGPKIAIDLKPTFTREELVAKLGGDFTLDRAAKAWRLSKAAVALLRMRGPFDSGEQLAGWAKSVRVVLRGPRPLAEAISTAGGVRWDELDDDLMLKRCPGAFCAGEMIDWEAPTGGYLLQGCLATGTRAAGGAVAYVS